ncbi:MAG: GFA family protein [Sulfitobacter sp.]
MSNEVSGEDLIAPHRRNGHLSGRCLCGAVTIEIDGDYVAAVGVCHCKMCQRWNGTMFGCFVASADAVTMAGEVTCYTSSTFSERGFCVKCGSHIFLRNTGPDEAEIELFPGLFDQAREFPLVSEIYTDRAPHYTPLAGDHQRKTRAEYESQELFVEGDNP